MSEPDATPILLQTGERVPDLCVPASGTADETFRLHAAQGRWLVLYFYPKDDTPGCTSEAAAFRDVHAAFVEAGCVVAGVSRDSVASHRRFAEKLGLPFPLLSDGDEALCTLFDVIRLKNLYGKQVRGIERSTFVIDPHGVLQRAWRGVKVPGHAEAVLMAVRELQAGPAGSTNLNPDSAAESRRVQ